MRARAGPGCGELKTKGLLRFPPARGCGGLRDGGGSTEAGAPEVLPACAPRSPQQTASRQLSLVLSGHDLHRSGGSLISPSHTGARAIPSKRVLDSRHRGAPKTQQMPQSQGRGHPDPRVSNTQGATPSLTIIRPPLVLKSPSGEEGHPRGPVLQGRSVGHYPPSAVRPKAAGA